MKVKIFVKIGETGYTNLFAKNEYDITLFLRRCLVFLPYPCRLK